MTLSPSLPESGSETAQTGREPDDNLTIDAVVAVLLAEFPDAWWQVNSNGEARIRQRFDYWQDEMHELYSDVADVRVNMPREPAHALRLCLGMLRADRDESVASLAKRPVENAPVVGATQSE